MRRAHLHGPVAALQAGQAGGVCTLYAARRAGYQPFPHQPSDGSARQRQDGAAVAALIQRSRNERSGGSAGNSAARFSFIAVTASRTWALLQIAPWIQPICLSESSTEWSRA